MSRLRNPNDLIRIEDAIKVLCRQTCHPGIACPDIYCKEMWDEFEDVERVEVVRCRDCQYWKRDHELDGYPLFEGHMVCKYAIGHSFVRYPHDFCSKGVRKDCNNEAD